VNDDWDADWDEFEREFLLELEMMHEAEKKTERVACDCGAWKIHGKECNDRFHYTWCSYLKVKRKERKK
jgi:hypothetical protein